MQKENLDFQFKLSRIENDTIKGAFGYCLDAAYKIYVTYEIAYIPITYKRGVTYMIMYLNVVSTHFCYTQCIYAD